MRLLQKDVGFVMNFIKRFSTLPKIDYKRCYEILQVTEGSNSDEIKDAYLNLVKKYHPDSGTEYASVEKFQEIDQAFKVLSHKISKDKETDEVEEQDIKHTAPQHRQYLSYGGYGVGNPFQREKQYTKYRSVRAAQNVFKHRVEKSTAEEHALIKKKSLRHDIKTKYGVDRLVEDLIQESMSKGEFSKLSGVGKPLQEKHNRNPYLDFVTHKLNEVLIDNGFTPEWITLNKEIRDELKTLRNQLHKERKYFKKYPLNEEDEYKWQRCISNYKTYVKDMNGKIDKFNLVVPILNKQFFHINLEREAQNVLINGEFCDDDFVKKPPDLSRNKVENSSFNSSDNLFGFFERIFK